MARKRKTEPRQKQGYLDPTLAPASIPELDGAAEEYVDARDARMKMGKKETECGAELLRLMHEHKLKEYEFDGQIVTLAVLEKVKVRKNKEGSDDE